MTEGDGRFYLLNIEDEQTIDLVYSIGDKNLDGKLSKDEFKQTMLVLRQVVQNEEIDMYWPLIDSDKDGQISKHELTAVVDQY